MAEESKQFWGNIWSQSADHKRDAKWLRDLQSEPYRFMQITKISNQNPWTNSGPGGFQFGILPSIFFKLPVVISIFSCFLTLTSLCKSRNLFAVNVEVIDRCNCRSDNAHLDQEKLLPEEQKGCRKGSRGTNHLLYIDRAVIKEVKSRKKNLVMAWIDYKKAYDKVAHLCIIECLYLFGVAENINSLSLNSMEKSKVMLC